MRLPLDSASPSPLAVHSRRLAATPDPLALHRALCGARADTLLFETADAPDGTAARSLLVPRAAVRLELRGRRATFEALTPLGADVIERVAGRVDEAGLMRVGGDETQLIVDAPAPPRDVDDRARVVAPSVLDAARLLVGATDLPPGTPDLAALVAGVFAYDLVDAFEDLPAPAADPLGTPDLRLWLAEQVVVVDHAAGTTTVHELVRTPDARGGSLVRHDGAALEALVTAIESTPTAGMTPLVDTSTTLAADVDLDDATYERIVTRCQEAITAGEVFQVVPSREFTAPCPDPLAAYEALRALNPSPYMFFVTADEETLFGASPETAVKVTRRDDGARELEVCPIAGTRARGKAPDGTLDVDLDDRLEAELRLDAKELAEHMMLVDLARNDVARVCRAGTRRVSRLLTVERYSHVMHLVSRVTGALRDELDALHAYQASMNMGTLTGAPKVRAAQILREVETTKRGAFGGAVGYVTRDGTMDSAIVIRSAVVQDGTAHVRAGAGVVDDSVPASEADETRRKAGAVLAALAASRRPEVVA